MSTAEPKLMTEEEFLALPEDGTQRMLIRGVLWENKDAMTVRNRHHGECTLRLGQLLNNWIDEDGSRIGRAYGGEIGFRLPTQPESIVGIDVAYATPQTANLDSAETTLVDGFPILAIEILSPSDKMSEIHSKIETYLSVGVRQVWIVDPILRSISVNRVDEPVTLYSGDSRITADPDLPGFSFTIPELFRR